jgi:hypothetical protein
MEEKRRFYGFRVGLALLITIIVFISIFFMSYGISYYKSRSVAVSQEKIHYSLLNYYLKNQLMISNCIYSVPSEFSTELDSVGNFITTLEKRFGKTSPEVLEQKKIYSMLELQHYNLIKTYNLECNKNISIIFFFYSNNANFVDSAERIGFILSSLKTQNKNVMIYSFDYDLDFDIIQLLKKKYNITEPNTILINEKVKLLKITNIDEVSRYTS